MFKTKLMTAAAVMTLTAVGVAGMAHAQETPNVPTQAEGSVAVTDPAPAETGITTDATADAPQAPVRSKAENNRMSRKAENKLTAELNQEQLQNLPSTSLAASTDTGLRTTDNSSVAAGSVASPTPQTATGDTVAPTDDSTMPPSQTETPTLPNSTVEALPDEGKPATPAVDQPEVQ